MLTRHDWQAGTDGYRLKGGHQAMAVVLGPETLTVSARAIRTARDIILQSEKMPESAILHTIRHVYLSV